MKPVRPSLINRLLWRRNISSTCSRRNIRDIAELPNRNKPRYQETHQHDLLSLQWPSPPRNILLIKKDHVPAVTESFVEYAQHIHSSYPNTSIILEKHVADELEDVFEFPVYTKSPSHNANALQLHHKVDLISTLGGDGTILHASALFAASLTVPPILSFSMGTLGFLGEWKFKEYKRAFREVHMSGAGAGYDDFLERHEARKSAQDASTGTAEVESPLLTAAWPSLPGKYMGQSRNSRVLLRNRLKIGVFSPAGARMNSDGSSTSADSDAHAINEVIIHRGRDPHLAVVEVFVGGRFLTEAVADGIIISTPTGSTAYSLSSGGSIVHPLVSSLLLTPICPRSLSFRPLVLPGNTPITLRLSEKNRGREVEVSVDGVRRSQGLGVGMEVRVVGEEVRDASGAWIGGVPSIVRRSGGAHSGGEDSWVGGLNGLLKFNYPFGEET